MKVIQVAKAGGTLDLTERSIPEVKPNWVRIKVQACGVCHSDMMLKEGQWPGVQYPRVPGHEVAGVIDEVGPDVKPWKKGQRVGVGWYGGHCGICEPCRRGELALCRVGPVTGFSHDGGYAEYMIAPAQSLAAVPDELTPEVVAPLMCAGITTYNALRNSGARPGDLVAIQAIGGLGHLAVQYANKFGYRVVAIGRDDSTKDLALKLGASAHIASGQTNAAEELQKMGGAKVILCTAPSGKAMSGLIGGLGVLGKLLVVGASGEAIEVTPVQLIGGELTVTGWAAGTSIDSEDALRFSQLSGVRPMIEKFPLARAAEAYDRMMSGKARFRVVIMME
jgi:D-arabinose 1-dehydrogenase-like Zn-dependent alcohol dehydrogenase